MLPLLALAALQQNGRMTKDTTFDGLLGKGSLLIQVPLDRLPKPQRSPKQGWEFDWTVAGYVQTKAGHALRFETYSQESTQGSARPESLTRLLLRLYSFNYAKMRLEHATDYGQLVVQAYLCYGGEPGGEQLFDVDKTTGGKVNTIYFYDLSSFTDPVEAVREVAHEYGHATLPPVGGNYEDPEDWASGYLGEKLYVSYLADARKSGALGPEDTFGASPEALRLWVKKNVDPLVEQALTTGPDMAKLGGKGKEAMDAYIGLALATARLYDPLTLCHAMYAAGKDPRAFPEAASVAAEERPLTKLNVPESLRGKTIWIPLGKDPKRNILMGGTVLGRKDGWARVRLTSDAPVVRNVPE